MHENATRETCRGQELKWHYSNTQTSAVKNDMIMIKIRQIPHHDEMYNVCNKKV